MTTPSPGTTTGGGDRAQARLGNAEVQRRRRASGGAPPTAGTCGPDPVRLPSPVPPVGELGYYDARASDFERRYADCGRAAPTYYRSYGRMYVERFTNETNGRLTPEGQAWLGRARVNLQVAIERRRDADPTDFDRLEKNDGAFTSFAYGTHADAYWSAGLGELDVFDLANIGLTPDVRDLLARDGLIQVADIGSRLLGVWGASAVDYMAGEGTAQELVGAAYGAYAVVGADIDAAFGAGTAARLEDGARQLGTDAGDLANDAYGVAADVVGQGVSAIDGQMGANWTESTLDAGRVAASDGVDTAESTYHSAEAWAADVWDWFSR